jgi:hypothetical protein
LLESNSRNRNKQRGHAIDVKLKSVGRWRRPTEDRWIGFAAAGAVRPVHLAVTGAMTNPRLWPLAHGQVPCPIRRLAEVASVSHASSPYMLVRFGSDEDQWFWNTSRDSCGDRLTS